MEIPAPPKTLEGWVSQEALYGFFLFLLVFCIVGKCLQNPVGDISLRALESTAPPDSVDGGIRTDGARDN
jgi:hypothetical protein